MVTLVEVEKPAVLPPKELVAAQLQMPAVALIKNTAALEEPNVSALTTHVLTALPLLELVFQALFCNSKQ